MTKIFTLEVTKESRALVTIEAENLAEANQQVKDKVAAGEGIEWKMVDHVIIDLINSKQV